MRIIAGTHRGRTLDAPSDQKIRPTSDKVRGAIFNALQARVDFENLNVMDIFCGTGALGLESLSRGAASCTFIDQAPGSILLAKKNAKKLDLDQSSLFITADAARLKPRPIGQNQADLFFCDPPYNQNLITPALQSLLDGEWLADECIGILECEKSLSPSLPDNFQILSEKIYGDTKIILITFQA